MPYLVYDNNVSEKSIPIMDDIVEFNIGRSMDNDVRLREDSSVSRKHCMIFKDPASSDYVLRDLGSSNGTFLNELCLQNQQCPMRDGDVVGVGDVHFTFYSHYENPYELVDTTTIYVQKAVPDLSPPSEYPFKDTTRLKPITPTTVVASEEDNFFPPVDGFEFIRLLGGGNYSTAYLVFQAGLKRTVALKTFHTDTITEPQQRLFLQQISNVGKLNHPNILGFIDAGITDSLCYVAMQYAPQGTLATLISQFPQGIAEADAIGYILPLAEAMMHASEFGLFHGDLSPSNILFNENSMPAISDLGLAPWIANVFQTDRRYFFGATQYMPPEQTLDQKLDWTSDQYAMGAMFYELLTGKPPFSAPSAYALIEKHLREKIRFPSSRQISDKTKQIVIKLMAKTPEERFPSWQAVVNAIKSKKHPTQSKKNLPLQKKGLAKIKKTGSGIKITAKKKPIAIKRKI
jgi:serine/threonine protein kinase